MNTTYWIGHTLFRAASKALFSYQVIGRDKLITEGPVIIASNHESFLDPPFIGIAYDQDVDYLARKTLFRGPCAWLYPRWNAIPIDQEKPDMAGIKQIIRALKHQRQVVLFPEGQRTLNGELNRGQAGVGLIAAKSKALIQPVRIVGAREALPRGSGKLKLHPITLYIGDPIQLTNEEQKARSRDAYQAISDRIMAHITQLGPNS